MEYHKTLTQVLKECILLEYDNIKQFSDASGIPYMTISSVLKRGVENSVFGTIQRICEALDITVDFLLRKQSLETISYKIMELKDLYTDNDLIDDLKKSNLFISHKKDYSPDEWKKIAKFYRALFSNQELPDYFNELPF